MKAGISASGTILQMRTQMERIEDVMEYPDDDILKERTDEDMKYTISKLISGLYKPWSGEILFDGKPIGEIDKNIFRGSLVVVD